MKKKLVAAVALVATLSFLTACTASSEPAASPAPSESVAAPVDGAQEAPKPDTAGVPETVATVNGEKITKADFIRIYEGQFPQVLMQAQMSGQEIDQVQLRKQTVEGLVSTELLIQEAAKKKVSASAKDLESALNDIAKGNKMDKAEFLVSMEKQGLDEEAVRAQIRTQLEVERLIANEVGDFKPTEKELKAAYDSMLTEQKVREANSSTAAKVPAFKEIKPELEQQLKLQKEAAAVKVYVEKLRKGAHVTTNM